MAIGVDSRDSRRQVVTYSPDSIDADETLSRYAYESRHYRMDGTPKTKAFEPDRNEEVSVFRIDGLTGAEVWRLGDEAGETRGKAAKASITFLVARVYAAGLGLDSAEPPPRHAVIVDWPTDHLRLKRQQELASVAVVAYRPEA